MLEPRHDGGTGCEEGVGVGRGVGLWCLVVVRERVGFEISL